MSCARRFKRLQAGRAGFTLVEMAVVVVIAGILLMALLPALLDIRRTAQMTATQTNMQGVLRAVAAYTLAHGCLPCPTPPETGRSAAFGKVGTSGNTACGVCGGADGIVPFAALGIEQSQAKDGWGRWLTMHVDTTLTNPAACSASEIAQGLPGCAKADATASGLCKAGLAAGNRVTINMPFNASASAAVLVLSHGPNGYGAYRARLQAGACVNQRMSFPGGSPACTGSKLAERCNDKCQNPGHAFWQQERGAVYDDLMLYAGRNALVSLFGTAACTTPW